MNTETITGPFVWMTTYMDKAVAGKPGWRSRCIVEMAADGRWSVHSPTRASVYGEREWTVYKPLTTSHAKICCGVFSCEDDARKALAKAPPYPGAEA